MVAATVVKVALGDRSYDVVIQASLSGLGEALRRLLRATHCLVVTDTHVAPLWGDALRAELDTAGVQSTWVTLPAGEAHKHRDTWWQIVDGALAAGVDRKTPIVALGGGVVGDLAGFAAASVNRGVPFVQVPTTLLAMVDSSVGGKTGFNHARGKNLVGAFHQPALVWAALDTLGTLPARELRAGLGEVVKTALLADEAFLASLEDQAPLLADGAPTALAPVVAACVCHKAAIVAEDEQERGRRAVLNLGHTVGHGLETALGYGVLLHGEAVALGLVEEARWAVRAGHCLDPALPARLVALHAAMGLPTSVPEVPLDQVVAAMLVDKKASGDTLTVPVVVRVGETALVRVRKDELPTLLDLG